MSFPTHPSRKAVSHPWLGDIPEHWTITQLKRLVAVDRPITYGIVQAGPHVPDGVPYIRPADMTDESGVEFSENLLRTSPEIASAYSRSSIRQGDVVCSIGPSFGKVMITPGWLEGANLTQGTARIAVQHFHHAKFVFWALRSLNSYAQWEGSVGGATFRALNLGPLAETWIAVPPKVEQMSVARFVDRETAKIDALVTEQERLIELLQEKRQAVISHAATKGLNPDAPMKPSSVEWLGDVPAHWAVARLKNLACSVNAGPFGSSLTKDMYVESGYRVYGQEQVIPNDFSVGDYFVSQEKYDELIQYRVAPGDILISCVGTFGKVALVPEGIDPGIINPRLIRLRSGPLITSDYLVQLLRSQVVFEQFASVTRGGTMDVINVGTVKEIVLPVPSLKEQGELLAFMKGELNSASQLESEIKAGVQLLRERRSALISAAVTGQIDVRGLVEQEAA